MNLSKTNQKRVDIRCYLVVLPRIRVAMRYIEAEIPHQIPVEKVCQTPMIVNHTEKARTRYKFYLLTHLLKLRSVEFSIKVEKMEIY